MLPEKRAALAPRDDLDGSFSSYEKFVEEKESTIGRVVPRYYDEKDNFLPQIESVQLDPMDRTLLGSGIPNYVLDPKSFNREFPPLATTDQLQALDRVVKDNPFLMNEVVTPLPLQVSSYFQGSGLTHGFDSQEAWIQTYSGRRFNPLKPNYEAIVLQDVAHSLSMMCRFTGHCRKFYSVAQHSVLVSYICDHRDALWGLLHDASEAYLIDVPRPLKRSGKFQAYKDFEKTMQEAICKRFSLSLGEPPSVKRADTQLLATEARDLMSPLHPDWKQPVDPLPFTIDPWSPSQAKDAFIKRFFELTGNLEQGYQFYLDHKAQL
jgi:uncharacterized protein